MDWIAKVILAVNCVSKEFPEVVAKVKVSGCCLVVIVVKTQVFESMKKETKEALMNMLKYSGRAQDDRIFRDHYQLQQLLPVSSNSRYVYITCSNIIIMKYHIQCTIYASVLLLIDIK